MATTKKTTKAATTEDKVPTMKELGAAAKDINSKLELEEPIPETGEVLDIIEAIQTEATEGDGFFEDDGLTPATIKVLSSIGVELKAAEEEEAPAPKAKAKAKDKGGAPAKAKAKAPAKAAGPGVIGTIVAILQKKGARKVGVTKEEICTDLAAAFPDRSAESMAKTVAVQVPGRITKEKGINLKKLDSGAFVIA